MGERNMLVSRMGLVDGAGDSGSRICKLNNFRAFFNLKAFLFCSGFLLSVLAFAFPCAYAAPVAVQNPSFEENVPEDGGWTDEPIYGDYILNSINGWQVSGTVLGTFRPNNTVYPDGLPDGLNVAFLIDGYISQTLSETIKENYKYTLRVYVGRRTGYTTDTYSIQLLAGGNLLAQDNSSLPLSEGQFSISTVSYTAYAGDSNLGLPLEIRLSGINEPLKQVNFDLVTLDASPVGLNDGLVAYYPFNGNANDVSGNGNHGTEQGGVALTEDRFGNANSAYSFDGVDDYINIPRSDSIEPANSLTVSAWVNPDDVSSWHQIITKRFSESNDPYNSYILTTSNDGASNKWLFAVSNGSAGSQTLLNSTDTIASNAWSYIVGTYDGSAMNFYINGALVGSTLKTGDIGYSDLSLRIGRAIGGVQSFKGNIDDIRIYNRALTESEIQTLFSTSNPKVDTDGDGIFDDGDGNGIVGDNPCTDGETENCDDNCLNFYNPDQIDSDGNGIGNACEQTTVFELYQEIPTIGALDWESFTINGEAYLAVANFHNDSTHNVDSKIYKWDGTSFIEFQSIPTNGAREWKSFEINGETYLVIANYYDGSSRNINSKIYKWNGISFVDFQEIPTAGAIDWEYFERGLSTSLA